MQADEGQPRLDGVGDLVVGRELARDVGQRWLLGQAPFDRVRAGVVRAAEAADGRDLVGPQRWVLGRESADEVAHLLGEAAMLLDRRRGEEAAHALLVEAIGQAIQAALGDPGLAGALGR